MKEVCGLCVFEASFTSFGEGGAKGACYYDIIGVLLEDDVLVWCKIDLGVGEVRSDLGETVVSYRSCQSGERTRRELVSIPTEFFPAWLAILRVVGRLSEN